MIDDKKLQTEIEKILDRKTQSEKAINRLISEEMVSFKKDTGYSMSYINVPIIDITRMSDRRKDTTVGNIKINIDIGI